MSILGLKLIHVGKSGLWSVYLLTRVLFLCLFLKLKSNKIWRLENKVILPDKITDYRSKFSYQTLKKNTKTKPCLRCHCNLNGHNWTHGTVSHYCWEENYATLWCDARTLLILFNTIIGCGLKLVPIMWCQQKIALQALPVMHLWTWLSPDLVSRNIWPSVLVIFTTFS